VLRQQVSAVHAVLLSATQESKAIKQVLLSASQESKSFCYAKQERKKNY
jgi:hypothetical protein